LISSYTKDKDIDGVGIGVAGQVDYETGTVIFGGNIGWENFPLGRLLQEELNVPVFVENDANIFALGVWKYELGSKPESVLGVTLGTGIGGGFVYEGDLLRSKERHFRNRTHGHRSRRSSVHVWFPWLLGVIGRRLGFRKMVQRTHRRKAYRCTNP